MQPARRGRPSMPAPTTGRATARGAAAAVARLLVPGLAVAALAVGVAAAPARPDPDSGLMRIFPAVRVQAAGGPAGGLTPKQVRHRATTPARC